MGDPGAVVAIFRFQLFICGNFGKDLAVTVSIFAGDKRRHSPHRERAAFMAGLNQQTRIGAEERLIHRDNLTVG